MKFQILRVLSLPDWLVKSMQNNFRRKRAENTDQFLPTFKSGNQWRQQLEEILSTGSTTFYCCYCVLGQIAPTNERGEGGILLVNEKEVVSGFSTGQE